MPHVPSRPAPQLLASRLPFTPSRPCPCWAGWSSAQGGGAGLSLQSVLGTWLEWACPSPLLSIICFQRGLLWPYHPAL